MIFSVIPYYTLKLLKYCILKKVGFKIQPERFLNLFLIFREKFSLVSYKLVSYKKKNVYGSEQSDVPESIHFPTSMRVSERARKQMSAAEHRSGASRDEQADE